MVSWHLGKRIFQLYNIYIVIFYYWILIFRMGNERNVVDILLDSSKELLGIFIKYLLKLLTFKDREVAWREFGLYGNRVLKLEAIRLLHIMYGTSLLIEENALYTRYARCERKRLLLRWSHRNHPRCSHNTYKLCVRY